MGIFKIFFNSVFSFINGNTEDRYVTIESKVTVDGDGEIIISEALRSSDIPNFGDKHEEILKTAMTMYKDDDNRIKWLKSLHNLRRSKTGWILEGGKAMWGEKPYPTPKAQYNMIKNHVKANSKKPHLTAV